MKIGILGTGMVGQVVGKKLVDLGHDVALGSRDPKKLSDKKGWAGSLGEWLQGVGQRGRVATLAEAAEHGEIVINALHGTAAVDAFTSIEERRLSGKVVLDIANELDFSKGMPARSLARDEPGGSLGEKLQTALPKVKVVKALNTMNAHVMVDPKALAAGNHTLFICGNDEGAKAKVIGLLTTLGWSDILDLGDITAARGTELLLPLWLRLWSKLGSAPFNLKVVR